MRIHISTTKNTSLVPFNYQQKLVGTIHKWIGENSIHDKISLYSFSWLQGGKKVSDALDFPEGATMFLSFYDDGTMRKVIKTILENPLMFCGMSVTSIDIDETPLLENRELFYCASPIFIKRKMEDGIIRQFHFFSIYVHHCTLIIWLPTAHQTEMAEEHHKGDCHKWA